MYHATTLNQVLHKGNPKSVFFFVTLLFLFGQCKGCERMSMENHEIIVITINARLVKNQLRIVQCRSNSDMKQLHDKKKNRNLCHIGGSFQIVHYQSYNQCNKVHWKEISAYALNLHLRGGWSEPIINEFQISLRALNFELWKNKLDFDLSFPKPQRS